MCLTQADCWPAMSDCVDDGYNQGTKRCKCIAGYRKYKGLADRGGTEDEHSLCGINLYKVYNVVATNGIGYSN